MAKGEQRGNREAKKPKKEKPKESAAAPSTKGTVASIASIQEVAALRPNRGPCRASSVRVPGLLPGSVAGHFTRSRRTSACRVRRYTSR